VKRWIFKLVLFLVMGATVTTATAWGLAVIVPPDGLYLLYMSRVEAPTNEPQWFFTSLSRPGTMSVYSNAELLYEPRGGSEVAPSWSRAATAPTMEDVDVKLHLVEHAHGWPMLSHLRSSTLWPGGGRGYAGWLITVPGPSRDAGTRLRTLPLAPVWPGFAINTIFYAALLWMLWLSPFVVRRLIRRKRGHCIKCGYDLRGTSGGGCPECGWEQPRRQTSPA